MSNLDNLTSKILTDAKSEADEIIKNAQEKANQKYDLEMKMQEESVNCFLTELSQVQI